MKHLSFKNVKTLFMAVLALVLVVSMTIAGTVAYLKDKATVTNTVTVGKVKIKLDETDITKTDGSRTDENQQYHFVPREALYVKDPTVTVLKGSEKCYVRMKVTVESEAYKAIGNLQRKCGIGQQCGPITFEELVSGLNTDTWKNDQLYIYINNTLKNEDNVVCTKLWDLDGDNDVNGMDATFSSVLEAGMLPGPITHVLYFNYKDAVDASNATEDVVLPALFKGISYPLIADPNSTKPQNGIFYGVYDGMIITVEAQAIQAEGFDSAEAAWTAFDGLTN